MLGFYIRTPSCDLGKYPVESYLGPLGNGPFGMVHQALGRDVKTEGLPKGSIVVPFLGITLQDFKKYEPQKGTTLGPLGRFRV